MLPGPVFNFELMATARRTRFYLVRAFYAAILFLILWGVHATWAAETGGELGSHMVSWFAFSALCAITIGQEILVLLLTPALVAGVIADEKQRKTLHYLMASQLTSGEIVLGKLLVRMLYVIVLLGVSLPVLSLLVLMGGIDPRLVLLTVAATLSTGWFLAALSVWVSTIARRVREAFFITYGLECLWLFSPFVFQNLAVPSSAWHYFDEVMRWLADWVGATSPITVGWRLIVSTIMSRGRGSGSDVSILGWMIGLQAASGLVLALLAAVQLRPIFRRQDSAGGIRAVWQFLFRRRRRRRSNLPGQSEPQVVREFRPARSRAASLAPLASTSSRRSSDGLERVLHGWPARLRSICRLPADCDRRRPPRLLRNHAGPEGNPGGVDLRYLLPSQRLCDLGDLGRSCGIPGVSRGCRAFDLHRRNPGRCRRSGGVHDLGTRRRHLGQLDIDRSHRSRDRFRQDVWRNETRRQVRRDHRASRPAPAQSRARPASSPFPR